MEAELLLRFEEAEVLAGDEDAQNDDQAEYRLDYTAEEPERHGLYRDVPDGTAQLANFGLVIDEDITVQDDVVLCRMFLGRVELLGTTSEIRIAAEDFANQRKFPRQSSRRPVPRPGFCARRRSCEPRYPQSVARSVDDDDRLWLDSGLELTWPRADGSTPRASIPMRMPTAKSESTSRASSGPLARPGGTRVGRAGRSQAFRRAGLPPARSSCGDLQPAGDRRSGAAPAVRRGDEPLRSVADGPTGDGKSFVAKLTQNFFGDFPLNREGSHFANWSSTSNFLQKQGYFFRDALFLIDDYKPELIRQQAEIVRILQAYADGSRGAARRRHDDQRQPRDPRIWCRPVRMFLSTRPAHWPGSS